MFPLMSGGKYTSSSSSLSFSHSSSRDAKSVISSLTPEKKIKKFKKSCLSFLKPRNEYNKTKKLQVS